VQPNIQYTQNFLRDPVLVNQLVEQAAFGPGETVLEIGPGKGIITQALANAVGESGRVIAVELDPQLANELERQFSLEPQVEILHQDFLDFDLRNLGIYSVFANLPFSISSLILEKLLNPFTGPQQAFLILQTESLVHLQGRKTQPTFKSLLFEPFYHLEIMHHFQKSDFMPAPRVETALFHFSKRSQPSIEPRWNELWKDFLAAVSQDRVGEGRWRRLFLSRELNEAIRISKLQKGKGIHSQNPEAFVQLFTSFIVNNEGRQKKLIGSFAALRKRQASTLEKNESEGHKPARS
jgi:23S rRNA (adenine-N6)-dimethyltransferase